MEPQLSWFAAIFWTRIVKPLLFPINQRSKEQFHAGPSFKVGKSVRSYPLICSFLLNVTVLICTSFIFSDMCIKTILYGMLLKSIARHKYANPTGFLPLLTQIFVEDLQC